MSTTTTTKKHISLDFYNNSIANVNAKQSDANSRYINVTCTEHGKKATLNKNDMSAFVRGKKSDGTYIYNEATILDDGTIDIILTSQMLANPGKQTVDIMILSTPDDVIIDNLDDLDKLKGVAVISVMSFYIIVSESAIDSSVVTSSNEYDALIQATSIMKTLEKNVRDREIYRDEKTEEAIIATDEANLAASSANTAASSANDAASKANTAASSANSAATKANTAASSANTAASSANDAASKANAAAEEFKSIKDQSGIVMQTEKGQANGIATLNSSGKVPSSQLSIVNNLTTTTTGSLLDASQGNALRSSIEALQSTIDELSTIYFNTEVDNSIGRNGDILMVPIPVEQ